MDKTKWFGVNVIHFLNKWIKLPLEIVGFYLLISHSVPERLVTSGWLLFGLVVVALIGLLITNFWLMFKSFKIKQETETIFLERIDGINKKHGEEETLLKDSILNLEKRARYAEVFPMLNGAFQVLHSAVRNSYDDKTKYHEHFMSCCYSLEKAYIKITGHECHVSIKIIQFSNSQIPSASKISKNISNVLLRTYCRSSYSASTRNQIDFHKQITHPIKENTDFEEIHNKHADYFFCNDLTQLDIYNNSSLKLKQNGDFTIYPKAMTQEQKEKAWPLDYKATIVAPIRPIVKENKEDRIILGFLCIDSMVPGVFNEAFDKHILIGCADGIYNSFYKIFNIG
jgi:hypothetical protein